MKRFTDKKGVTWKIAIHFGNLPTVYDETGVRLALLEHPIKLEGDDPEAWIGEDGNLVPGAVRLFTDVELTFSIIYSLLREQAEAEGLSRNEFAQRIAEEEGLQERMFVAFQEELQDFFRSTRKNQVAEMIGAYSRLLKKAVENMTFDLSLGSSSQSSSPDSTSSSGEQLATSESIPAA